MIFSKFLQYQPTFTTLQKNGIAILFTLLLLPTFLVFTVSIGLDPSWILGLNISVFNNQIFGEDYIFTYGVLGFLHTRCAYNFSKWYLLLFDFLILINVYWIIKSGIQKISFLYQYIVFSLVLLILVKFNFFIFFALAELIMICGAGMLLCSIQQKNFYYFISFTILCALAIHIKISYGFLLFILFFVGFAYIFWQKTFLRVWLIIPLLLYFSIFLGISFYFKVNIAGYIVEGSEIISGYNEAMFLVTKPFHLFLALIFTILFLISMFFEYKNCENKIFFLLIFFSIGLSLFYTFKAQFVRAEGRQMVFFGCVSAIYGLYYLQLNKPLFVSKIFFFLIIVISIIFVIDNKIKQKSFELSAVFSVSYLTDIFTDISYKNTISKEDKEKIKLPEKIIHIIKNGSVDILPTEISLINIHNLKYNPRPIPQTYSAYTPRLDSLNANKYLGKNAPDFLIFDNNQTIDNRYAFWEESKTKLAIFTNYELVYSQKQTEELPFDEKFYLLKNPDVAEAFYRKEIKNGYEHYIKHGKAEGRIASPDYFGMLLFKRKTTPKKLHTKTLKKTTEQLGKVIKIDENKNFVYIYPKIKYNTLGKITKFLYRPPLVEAKIKYEDGQEQVFRAIVPILRGGIFINYKIISNVEAQSFFEHNFKQSLTNNKKIKEITFFSKDESLFLTKDFEVIWEEKSLIE